MLFKNKPDVFLFHGICIMLVCSFFSVLFKGATIPAEIILIITVLVAGWLWDGIYFINNCNDKQINFYLYGIGTSIALIIAVIYFMGYSSDPGFLNIFAIAFSPYMFIIIKKYLYKIKTCNNRLLTTLVSCFLCVFFHEGMNILLINSNRFIYTINAVLLSYGLAFFIDSMFILFVRIKLLEYHNPTQIFPPALGPNAGERGS